MKYIKVHLICIQPNKELKGISRTKRNLRDSMGKLELQLRIWQKLRQMKCIILTIVLD